MKTDSRLVRMIWKNVKKQVKKRAAKRVLYPVCYSYLKLYAEEAGDKLSYTLFERLDKTNKQQYVYMYRRRRGMSRSYRKFPVFIDRERRVRKRWKAKTLANRAVRRQEIGGGKSAYKRIYDSWDICDYRIKMENLTELRTAWKRGDPRLRRIYRTLREAERDYKVSFYRK